MFVLARLDAFYNLQVAKINWINRLGFRSSISQFYNGIGRLIVYVDILCIISVFHMFQVVCKDNNRLYFNANPLHN